MTLGHSFEGVLEAARLGADWAWASLYCEIAGPVMGFFRVRGVADPEEAAGDVFFELTSNLDRFEGNEESFRTLVFVIAYRRLMAENRYSNTRRRSALSDRVLDHLKTDFGAGRSDVVDDVPEEIRRAFEMLTPEQRDVLSLRILAGLSVEQVAEVLERGIKTVLRIQRRGMGRVRNQFPVEAALI